LRTILFPLVTVILFGFLTFAQASEIADHQNWDGIGVSKQVNPKFELALDKEIRYKSGFHFKNFDKVTIALNYDVTRWFEMGLQYWRGQIRSVAEWRKEQKPVLVVKFTYNFPRCELSARHKLEYRIIQKYDNIPVYKFRTQVKYPVNNHKLISETYINNEMFVNLKENGFYLNRIRAGVKLNSGFLSPDINYVFQLSNKNDEWTTVHAFAVKVWMEF